MYRLCKIFYMDHLIHSVHYSMIYVYYHYGFFCFGKIKKLLYSHISRKIGEALEKNITFYQRLCP